MAVTPTTPTVNAQEALLRIDSVQVLPKAAPQLTVGNVLSFVIRENPATGPGLLYYQGSLIPATLPETLKQGDRVTAQVSENGSALLLKLLSVQSPTPQQEVAALDVRRQDSKLETVLQLVRESFSQTILPSVSSEQALKIPLEGDTTRLAKLLESVIKDRALPSKLEDPSLNTQTLRLAAQGALTQNLRDAAQAIDDLVENHTSVGGESRFMLELRAAITAIAEVSGELPFSQDSEGGGNDPARAGLGNRMQTILRMIAKELESPRSSRLEERESLRQIQHSLSQSFAQIGTEVTSQPTDARSLLLSMMPGLTLADMGRRKSQETQDDLKELSTRLEQLATMQDSLNQLNPVMQLLGQPALILFPFILHGFLNHGEIAVDPDHRKNKSQDGSSKSEGQDGFQRVQLTLPLPSIGAVHVDVAHRQKEVLLRITVADEEAAAFLRTQLKELRMVLEAQGFEKSDLSAHLGVVESSAPDWSKSLSAYTNLVA